MPRTYEVLIMGASYGSLLGMKIAAAGHAVTLACRPEEVAAIAAKGVRIRMPVKGVQGLVEIDTRNLPGKLTADVPASIDPHAFDLVVLGMQEPQYGSVGVRSLLEAIANAKVPCMSIMNMPPPPYLERIPGVDANGCLACYTDPGVWHAFDPSLMTLCSPDPQAFRPPGEPTNVLQVRLPTNFKVARFDSEAHTSMLRELANGIDAFRFDSGRGEIELPVKLRVHDSVFVPLAKWSMLIAGNYRCVQKDGVRSIKEAVHGNIDESRAVYQWVTDLCRKLGASANDLVPFEKYANAAQSLESPSSAARALANGATNIERVDKLVQAIGTQQGMRSDAVDAIVTLVDHWLATSRQKKGS
ncbi:MAG: hypothetical protein ABI440_02170 [Casimicrobiaceae bacterium]